MTAPRKIGEQIKKLHQSGKTYREICDELSCSKGTVAYHVGKNVKEKQKNYSEKHRVQRTVSRKIDTFYSEYDPTDHKSYFYDVIKRIDKKIMWFTGENKMSKRFTYQELLNKIGDDPTCYISGDKINIADTRSWHLDHIIPKSKGGDNSLENCDVCTRQANMSKTDMTPDEFFAFCQKVLENQGYSISK